MSKELYIDAIKSNKPWYYWDKHPTWGKYIYFSGNQWNEAWDWKGLEVLSESEAKELYVFIKAGYQLWAKNYSDNKDKEENKLLTSADITNQALKLLAENSSIKLGSNITFNVEHFRENHSV